MPAAAEGSSRGSGAPQVVLAVPSPEMPGGLSGDSARGSLGFPRAVSALGHRPQPPPNSAACPGYRWSLRCPWTWWAGCGPRGIAGGTRARSSLSRKESPPPPPHRPSPLRTSPVRTALPGLPAPASPAGFSGLCSQLAELQCGVSGGGRVLLSYRE